MKTSNLLLSALLITASSQAFATKNIIESVENAIDSPSQSLRQSAQNVDQDPLKQAGQSLNNLLNTVATAPSNIVGSVNQDEQDVQKLADNLSNTPIGTDTGASANTSGGNVDTGVKIDENNSAVNSTSNPSTTSSSTTDPQKKSSKSSVSKKEKSNKSSIKNKDKKSGTTSAPSSGGTVTPVSQPANKNHTPSSSHKTPTSSVTHPHAGNAASNGSINHPREADQHPVSTTAPGHDHAQQPAHDAKPKSHDKQEHDSQAYGTQPPSKKKNV